MGHRGTPSDRSDFQGRPWVLWSAPWPLLIRCPAWALHGLLGDTGGVSRRSWCRKQLHNLFRQGEPGSSSPPPFSLFFLTCYPGLVRSCRQALERRVLPFRPPSPVSRGFEENCLSAAQTRAQRCLPQARVQSGAKAYPLLESEHMSEYLL